jgi:hypothetical protein
MTALYLLTVADEDAARLESWFGGALRIAPASSILHLTDVTVAGLDAITDEETAAIRARLASGSPPIYHAGGPGVTRDQPPPAPAGPAAYCGACARSGVGACDDFPNCPGGAGRP